MKEKFTSPATPRELSGPRPAGKKMQLSAMSTKDGCRVCVAAIGLEDVAALQLAQPSLGKMAVKEPAQPFWCHIPRLAPSVAVAPRLFASAAACAPKGLRGANPR